MKITFIYPRFEKLLESRLELTRSSGAKKHLGDFSMPPALGIPIMTALSKDQHEVKLFDENIEDVYQIDKTNRYFIPEDGWKNVAVPLHPGAEKYYKEAGYMDE